MDILDLLGYSGALATGIVLGLLGGGGAMFAIPVLVYLFHIEASIATGYSLFLIGVTASVGAIQNIRMKAVEYPAVLGYGIPSLVAVYLVRRFVIPNLPDVIVSIGRFSLGKDHFILTFLAFVMFIVGYKMIFSNQGDESVGTEAKTDYFKMTVYALAIGALLGIVGVGGGILMTPALVYFARLPIKRAIATSLVLVAINSFIGFIGDVQASISMDWSFLLSFSAFSVSGVFIGNYFQHLVDGKKMKTYFGWSLLIVGGYIIIRETIVAFQ